MTLRIDRENAEFQIIDALKNNRSKRSKAGEVFIEGTESIKQAHRAGMTFSRIITPSLSSLSPWGKNLLKEHREAKVIELASPLYTKLCDRSSPSEMLVTVKRPSCELESLKLPDQPFILLFDRPSDRGNFGTLIRSANSFRTDVILVLGHGIDVYDPKVIRSSLGSVFHSPVVQVPSLERLKTWIQEIRQKGNLKIIGSDSTGTTVLPSEDFRKPLMLVIGNEAKGMSVALQELCDIIVSIPLAGEVNSLNVSCAASIMLWEVYKQDLSGTL